MLKYHVTPTETSLRYLEITYKNEPSVKFVLESFLKNKATTEGVFHFPNEYLAKLPDEAVKELFVMIMEHNSSIKDNGSAEYVSRLSDKVARVVEILNYQQYIEWFRENSNNVLIPNTVKKTFTVDRDLNSTREKTYVLDEYISLLGLATFVRLLAPFLVDFFRYHRIAKTNHCFRTFELLTSSDIYNSDELWKLKEYLEANQASAPKNDNELIFDQGISTDDALDDIVAELLLSKLYSVDFINSQCNATAYAYQTLMVRGRTYGSSVIRTKSARKSSSEEEYSVHEDYRKTSNVTHGEIVEMNEALRDIESILTTLDVQSFPIDQYHAELKLAREYIANGDITLYLTPPKLVMVGWLLSKYTNPRTIHYLDRDTLTSIIVMFKMIALMDGYPHVGLFLNSYIDLDSDYINPTSNISLGKEMSELIAEHYSYIEEGGKATQIEQAITNLSKSIESEMYKPLNELKGYEEYINKDGILIPSKNLSLDIARLVMKYIV